MGRKSIITFWYFRRFRDIYAVKILDAFTIADMDSRLDAVTKADTGAAMRKASGQRAHKKRADRMDSPYHVFVIVADYAFFLFDIFRQKIGINSTFSKKHREISRYLAKTGVSLDNRAFLGYLRSLERNRVEKRRTGKCFSTNIDKRSTETVQRRKKHIKIKIFLRDRHVLFANGMFCERNGQNNRKGRALRENRIEIP